MSKNLVIVESPAKAKTIEKFLGKDYQVKSSFGHIRDLPKQELSIDVENNYKPTYEISPDKKKIIKELTALSKSAEIVWLASDEDREGEAIAWHLSETLKLDKDKTKRIAFHEITKPAIEYAIQNPRAIDENLVNAQQARRVLDRLVGYELSPVLWRKVKPAISAGRVQSVAVRLVVEREEEIRHFKQEIYYKVVAQFIVDNKFGKGVIPAELSQRFSTKEEAVAFLQSAIDATFTVYDIEKKPGKRSPAPPFTTSTLQQEASRKLGFSVSKTMMIAQQLYENGQITYMRTDSVNLSELAINAAKEVITNQFGNDYFKPRQYQTKSKGAQEAHEAIRPTYLHNSEIEGMQDHKKLYNLIWKRTVASQMSDAKLEKTTIQINISNNTLRFTAHGEVIIFDGFLKVYHESTDEENSEEKNGLLPQVVKGEELDPKEINATQRFTQSPARYTEASLVKKMEELGIGRPSTYAPTITTILKRDYVQKLLRPAVSREYDFIQLKGNSVKAQIKKEQIGAEKDKLSPTDMGILVNNFLMEYFYNIIDYNFTANVEKEFDEIAEGDMEWTSMIDRFYKPFHKTVDNVIENSHHVRGERNLGVDPATGKSVIVKMGRFGSIVQIGTAADEEKPRYAALLKNQSIDTIILEEALELFRLPRVIGHKDNEELVAAIGRYGPYIRFEGKFYSLGKLYDPLTITLEEAIEVINEKKAGEVKKNIKEFSTDNGEIKVLNGRYGPYISFNKKNYKIPKGLDPQTLILEECLEIIEKTDKEKGK
ncbi:MAG: type I DNA topoisomerase [Bacteroidales bacterium]|nr:type I DNA topoisomerase [Bacteroidales bacterium]